MSGAGKTTAMKTLEDAGYFCVDNLPIQLIKRFAEIAYDEQIQVDNVAISVDIRSGRALSQLNACLNDMKENGYQYEILFMECSDEKLVKRVRNTAPMKHLNPTERQNNLKKAFIIGRNDVKLYDRIILVDDIYTTGTTLDEIAALLKEHGVSKVYCVTLACGSGV